MSSHEWQESKFVQRFAFGHKWSTVTVLTVTVELERSTDFFAILLAFKISQGKYPTL